MHGRMYFHPDCLKAKIDGDWKDQQTKADLQLIKSMWVENISNTVIYQQLFKCLNDLLERGIESEYLVFTMQYCVSNHLNLQHPMGFKYYVDRQEIKDAYARKKRAENRIDPNAFVAQNTDDNEPSFTVKQQKTTMQDILRGGNK